MRVTLVIGCTLLELNVEFSGVYSVFLAAAIAGDSGRLVLARRLVVLEIGEKKRAPRVQSEKPGYSTCLRQLINLTAIGAFLYIHAGANGWVDTGAVEKACLTPQDSCH
jgi:hypothetical protein